MGLSTEKALAHADKVRKAREAARAAARAAAAAKAKA